MGSMAGAPWLLSAPREGLRCARTALLKPQGAGSQHAAWSVGQQPIARCARAKWSNFVFEDCVEIVWCMALQEGVLVPFCERSECISRDTVYNAMC